MSHDRAGAAGVPARPLIRCAGGAEVNPCGAYDAGHHEAAAAAGVCCKVLAGQRQPDRPDDWPEAHHWPDFVPDDADAPAGDVW